LGTCGVHTNLARLDCVHKASSECIVLLTMKIPSSVKYKCPLRLMVCLSKRSNVTSGTKAPSKEVSHAGGNCSNKNLIESINEDSITPKGKAGEKRWHLTLAQRVMAGRGPLARIWTMWGTLV